ncbi:hypothetical protein BDV32DRAFT_88839 [Aspergillus pseudonomiae]|uniref:Uncharacterized protein n=1 Tax=Aspergillus pseudonomiae TaxID=1506151 RepID=A0A5N6HR87_9EURO|nr:uncharacterized protein BDV37DRAFT_197690 [Aspergillus pseudonomiae]KAB8257011.1 hypothetical protein BDV32DRAFT_88839 [Aspergillus pseudonomiae]KAE8400744.1 hypothetical protein BDV37DRAFT_197690 [Aspergillus pseudonomiae]
MMAFIYPFPHSFGRERPSRHRALLYSCAGSPRTDRTAINSPMFSSPLPLHLPTIVAFPIGLDLFFSSTRAVTVVGRGAMLVSSLTTVMTLCVVFRCIVFQGAGSLGYEFELAQPVRQLSSAGLKDPIA